jgi:hypothetical protein
MILYLGFKCYAGLDHIKGLPAVTSWHKDIGCFQIDTMGILGKIPRLTNDAELLEFKQCLDNPTDILDLPKKDSVADVETVEEEESSIMIGGATTTKKQSKQPKQPKTATTGSKTKKTGYKQRAQAWRYWRPLHPTGTLDELHEYYTSHYDYTPDNNTKEDRIRDWKHLDEKWSSAQHFDLNEHCDIITKTIPLDEFNNEKLKKRRQLVSPERLAQYFAVVVNDWKTQKYKQVAVSTYIKCFQEMYRAGIIDWTLNRHTAAFYHALLVKYGFVIVVEDAIKPFNTMQEKGKARTITIRKIADIL